MLYRSLRLHQNYPWVALLLLAVVGGMASFPYLSARPSNDEHIWISSGIKFQQALWRQEWQNTRLTTRPGVSVIWLTALTARHVFDPSVLLQTSPDLLVQNQNLILISRIVIACVLIVLNLIAYILLRQLTSPSTALVAALLLALHPIFTNIGYLTWPDVFLTRFFLLSLLAFLVYVVTRRPSYLWLTGIFFGSAILTKIIAWLLPALLGFAAVLLSSGAGVKTRWALLRAVGWSVLIGLALFYIWYPAAWQNPNILFDRAAELTPAFTSHHAVHLTPPWWEYPVFAVLVDPAVTVLALATLYGLARLWQQQRRVPHLPVIFLGAALCYLGAIYLVSFFKDTGIFAVRSDRYVAPAVPLLLIGVLLFFDHSLKENSRTRTAYSAIVTTLFIYYGGYLALQLWHAATL